MENSQVFDRAVIELGRKLIAKFDEQDGTDVLAKWMANHIAGLIKSVEASEGTSEEPNKRLACTSAILQLWAHRSQLPRGSRPFADSEAALQTLARLDPANASGFYFRGRERYPEDGYKEGIADSERWLQCAEILDKAARNLVQYCVSNAIDSSRGNLREWLEASYHLNVKFEGFDIKFVSALTELDAASALQRLANKKREAASRLLDELNTFEAAITELRTTLNKQISET